jgi:LysM repeat protein
METNDSNIKPQQTGGLKLMTVFVFVIAAHVVVIGGVTAYYLMKGGSSDDILTDQSHKSAKVADAATTPDGAMPDANQTDKNATASTSAPTSDTASGAINIPAPTPSAAPTASTDGGATSAGANPATTAPAASVPAQHGPVITPPQPAIASNSAVTPEAQPPVTINGVPYVVKAGDSLARIARQNHTTVVKLKASNSLTNDMLHIGQKMVIPAKTQLAITPAPAAGSDAAATTTILGDSPAAPSMSVPASAATVPVASAVHHQAAPTVAAAGHSHTYTVVKGDTLTKIAHKFKTTPTAIMTANSITDAAKLSIGKKLRIPGQEARSATNNEPVAPAAAQSQPNQPPAHAETTAQLANFVQ